MKLMDALSFSDARASLNAVMDRVCADKVAVAITRRGAEGVVMVWQSEWNSIEETLFCCVRRRMPSGCSRQFVNWRPAKESNTS